MAEQNQMHTPDPLFDDVPVEAPAADAAPAVPSGSEESRKLTLADSRPQLQKTLDRIAQKRAQIRQELARLGVRKRRRVPPVFEIEKKK
jgi:hypothetical protein